MFYDKTSKREIEVDVKTDGICVFFKDQKFVMFELEKPVPAFKAAEFNKSLTVSDSDKPLLTLMSATSKQPGVSTRILYQIETSDKTLSYNLKTEERGRLGGLIMNGLDPIGMHTEEEIEESWNGKGILFNWLIDEWIQMITDKAAGSEHKQALNIVTKPQTVHIWSMFYVDIIKLKPLFRTSDL